MPHRSPDITPIAEARSLEIERANLVLANDAVTGLEQALAGQFVSDDELDSAVGAHSLD
jgi:hypothetical protein